ncbi:unnamed protein product, partial [Effrenium voratum]
MQHLYVGWNLEWGRNDQRLPQQFDLTSRVQTTRHQIGELSILVANVYGYPRGPTWPRAAKLTDTLLSHITNNLVIGYSGYAAIVGDMNFDPLELDQMKAWQSYGWVNAQTLAWHRWQQEPMPTCKGSTERDQVDTADWQSQPSEFLYDRQSDPTIALQRFGKHFEDSLTGYVNHARRPSFPEWWQQQDFATLLGPLPAHPPDAQTAQWIFLAFNATFRQYEDWHQRQKSKLHKLKFDKTMKAIFQDLRDAPQDQIDTLWEEKTFTVLAVNHEDGMMHISDQVLASPHSSWTIDGIPVHITAIDGDLITSTGECQASPGSSVCQRTHHDTVPAVHEQLSQLWTPRWLSSAPPSQDDLFRITSFCTAHLPPGKLIFEDISIAQWRRALKRFKQHAAKGADGYMLADLTHMTDQHISFLLSMLHSIENNWDQIGLSTDVEKAFNMIKREPVFQVSAHIGLPERIIRPWTQHADFQQTQQPGRAQVVPPGQISGAGITKGRGLTISVLGQIPTWLQRLYPAGKVHRGPQNQGDASIGSSSGGRQPHYQALTGTITFGRPRLLPMGHHAVNHASPQQEIPRHPWAMETVSGPIHWGALRRAILQTRSAMQHDG